VSGWAVVVKRALTWLLVQVGCCCRTTALEEKLATASSVVTIVFLVSVAPTERT
jgi:hypothetical protein